MADVRPQIQAGDGEYVLAAWKLPVIVAAIAVPMVAGSYIGGPGLAMAIAALAASSIVVVAIRNSPRAPIVPPAAADGREHLLLVAGDPLESPAAIDRVVAATSADEESDEAEVLVLTPNRSRFVDRWASDTDRSHEAAQQSLVLTLASLAKAGIDAKARVGDEDVVQAVDDELRSYPATRVVLVDHPGSGATEPMVAEQLRVRLQVPFLHVVDRAAEARSAAL